MNPITLIKNNMKNAFIRKSILVTGGAGFIGSNFLKYTAESDNKNMKDKRSMQSLKNFYSKKLDYQIISPNHKELNIFKIEQLRKVFSIFKPNVVINFAAHRDANSAEEQRGNLSGSAWRTNVNGVRNLSKICEEYKSFLIHISTDMVFSGKRINPGPYSENDEPEKNLKNLSWYGWTKAEGERIVMKNKKAAIIRIGNVTQPIYDPKLDYVGKILYLFDHGELYPLFHDQHLTLTYVPSVLEAIEVLVLSKQPGIFHIASKNIFTPYKLSKYLIKKARGKTNVLRSISIKECLKKSPNRYPRYGGLSVKKTSKQLQVKLFDWERIVDFYIGKVNSSFH